ELIDLHVDVIIAPGTVPSRVAKTATATIPIVMVGVSNPVEEGFAASLARPGGNITGLTADTTPEVWSKRLQLLTEVAPSVSRVGLLWIRQAFLAATSILNEIHDVASKLKVTVRSMEVRGPDDFAPIFATVAREKIGAIVFVPSSDLFGYLDQIANL